MPSGAHVYRTLIDRIAVVQDEMISLSTRARELEEEVATLQDSRTQAFRGLAEFHLPEMSAQAVGDTLEKHKGRMREILDEKQRERVDSRRRRDEAAELIKKLEAESDLLTEQLNQLGQRRDELARGVSEELAGLDGYLELATDTQLSRERVRRSELRHEAALRERSDHLPDYEADPFFSYLLRQGYGTANPRGNGLTRRIDGWVADLVDFGKLKGSYDFLSELPSQMAAVLTEDRSQLGELELPLTKMETEAADRHGLSQVVREGESLYRDKSGVLERLEAADGEHRGMASRLDELADSRGEYYEVALLELQDYLTDQTIAQLEADARQTADPRDDKLVRKIDELNASFTAREEELRSLRETRETRSEKLEGLHRLRRQFLKDDYNGRRSRFDSSFDFDSLLIGYLAGTHRISDVRSHTRGAHHFHAPVSSGGFGGGGFSSGGGFGGGGFSTGGGF